MSAGKLANEMLRHELKFTVLRPKPIVEAAAGEGEGEGERGSNQQRRTTGVNSWWKESFKQGQEQEQQQKETGGDANTNAGAGDASAKTKKKSKDDKPRASFKAEGGSFRKGGTSRDLDQALAEKDKANAKANKPHIRLAPAVLEEGEVEARMEKGEAKEHHFLDTSVQREHKAEYVASHRRGTGAKDDKADGAGKEAAAQTQEQRFKSLEKVKVDVLAKKEKEKEQGKAEAKVEDAPITEALVAANPFSKGNYTSTASKAKAAQVKQAKVLNVPVPEGVGAGAVLMAETRDGQQVQVVVPEGVGAGQVLRVEYTEREKRPEKGEEEGAKKKEEAKQAAGAAAAAAAGGKGAGAGGGTGAGAAGAGDINLGASLGSGTSLSPGDLQKLREEQKAAIEMAHEVYEKEVLNEKEVDLLLECYYQHRDAASGLLPASALPTVLSTVLQCSAVDLEEWDGVDQVSDTMAREVLSAIGATGATAIGFGQFLACRMCGPGQKPGLL